MASLLRSFSQALIRRPVLSNMLVTGSLYAAGDISQQILIGNKKPNLKSAARIGIVGGLVLAPIYVPWYKMLDYLLPGKAVKFVVAKCFLDQFVLSPVTLSIFFIATSFLERKPDIFASFRERGRRAYITACLFWPPVQAVNFSLIPGQYRVVYISCVSFVWTNILCYIKSRPKRKAVSAELVNIRGN